MSDLQFFLVVWSAKSIVLVFAVWGGMTLLRNNLSAGQRSMVWLMTMLCIVLLPIFSQVFKLDVPLPTLGRVGIETPVLNDTSISSDESEDLYVPDVSPVKLPIAASDDIYVKSKDVSLLGVLWIVGVLMFSLRIGASALRLKQIQMSGESFDCSSWSGILNFPKQVKILLCSNGVTPQVFGILRPVIALPISAKGWDRRHLRSILQHEICHIERRDPLLILFTEVCCALMWLNPAVWLVRWCLKKDIERATDDRVLVSGIIKEDYAESLLAVAQAGSCDVLSAALRAPISDRIERVLSGRVVNSCRALNTLYASLFFLFALGLSAMTLQAGSVNRQQTVILEAGGNWLGVAGGSGEDRLRAMDEELISVIENMLKTKGYKVSVLDDSFSPSLADRADEVARLSKDERYSPLMISVGHGLSDHVRGVGVEISIPSVLSDHRASSVGVAKSIQEAIQLGRSDLQFKGLSEDEVGQALSKFGIAAVRVETEVFFGEQIGRNLEFLASSIVAGLDSVYAGRSHVEEMGEESVIYESVAVPLRQDTPRQYNFSKAILGDVLRLIAEDAGISLFISGDLDTERLVTTCLEGAPFSVLEMLASHFEFGIEMDDGIFYLQSSGRYLVSVSKGSPVYEVDAVELRKAAARQYNFSKAVLGDVLRIITEDAGINFVSHSDEDLETLVTFTVKASPFRALEALAKSNNLELVRYSGGFWSYSSL